MKMWRMRGRRIHKDGRGWGTSKLRRACALVQRLESRVLLSASVVNAMSDPTSAIPLNTSTWTAVGPAPNSSGNAGRLAGVAADPNNANILYIAAAGGGVWKTLDGGASWTPLTDAQTTMFMGAIAVAPSNSNVIYAGTGESTGSILSFYGRGVLKSTDGGTTWALEGNSIFNRRTISQLAVDPTNANIVYVSVEGNGVNGFGGNTGIWKTADGGNTWTDTTASINTSAAYTDVQIDPTNPQHLVCSVGRQNSAGGIYQTTNGGGTWTRLGGGVPSGSGFGNDSVAMSPSNPQVLYAAFGNPNSNGLLSMWTSTNGGTSWTQLTNTPNYMGGQQWYDQTLIVDPHNANIVYAAGQSGANSIIESTDGGHTWNDISTSTNGANPHADHHAMTFDADGRLIDGNDGGIWRLENPVPGSQIWSNLNANLQLTQFIGGALDPNNPNKAIAGSQDTGTPEFNGNLVWTANEGGDGGLVRIDQQNPNIIYHQAPQASFGTNNFFRKSTDGGITWSAAINGINPSDPQPFYSIFVVDPTNGNHLYYGTNHIYESTNAAASWSAIANPGSNGWPSGTNTVTAMALAPSSPGTVYAAIGGHLYVTTNDGATWTQHDPLNGAVGNGQLLVDPNNSQICYFAGSLFGFPHFQRTTNGGVTWTNLTGNLPDLPTYGIALNPTANTVYVGNDNGVYASTIGGTTWAPYGFGLPNVEVRDLAFNSNLGILAAFTHGRGAYEISTNLSAPIVVNTTQDETTPGDGLTSLREAVAQADAAGGGTITFDPSLTGSILNLTNGPLSISDGVVINGPNSRSLTISAADGSPLEMASGAVTISNLVLSGPNTVLQVDSGAQTQLQDVTIQGNVTDNGSLTLFQDINDTLSGSIGGSGSLIKTGPQTLTLAGNDNYSGGTTILAGTLDGSTLAIGGNVTVNYPGTLTLDQSRNVTPVGLFIGNVGGSGTVHILSGFTIFLDSTIPSTFSNSGPTVIDPGATLIATASDDISSTSTFFVNGTLDLGGFNQTVGALAGAATGVVYTNTSSNATATLTAGGNNSGTTFDGVLEDVPSGRGNSGILSLQKIGAGTLTLNRPTTSPNTYSGGTTISAGTLAGNTASLVGSFLDGSVLAFDQTLSSLSDGTFSGSVSGAGSLNVLAGTVRLAPADSLQNSGSSTITGTLVSPASDGLDILSGLSSYTVNGALVLGASDQAIGSLAGSGTVYHLQPDGQPTLATLTVGQDNSSTTFAGVLQDTAPASGNGGILALNKVGSGTFTVSGASTFTGGLTVSAGILGVGPSPAAFDPLGAGAVILSGGNLLLDGSLGTPVQQIIPATGYNQDVIVEAAAANAQVATTTTFDGNFVWYETGFPGSGTTGLPPNGSIFTSAFNSSVKFQLQPYTANNVAFMSGGGSGADGEDDSGSSGGGSGSAGSATLTLSNPTAFSNLNFLACAANGSSTLDVTLTFADSTTVDTQLLVSDWFNGQQVAFTAGGRILRSTTSTVSLQGTNPRLYEYDYAVPVADQTKLLTSITFDQTSGNQVGIYGLSGAATTALAAQSYPNAIQILRDATIDVESSLAANLGNLTMGTNLLSLTGPSGTNLTFGPVSVSAGSQFNTAAGTTLTLGPVSGAADATLSKLGDGTMVLSGADSYGGGTTVSDGTLDGSTSALNGNITVNSPATLAFDQSALPGTSGSFSGTIGGSGTVHILSGSSVQLGTTDGSTPSTFGNSGPTVIDSGATLIASAINDLGSGSAFIVDGTLDLSGFSQTVGSLAGAATGVVYSNTSSNITATLTAGGDNTSTTFAGILEDTAPASGNGGILSLNKVGAGALTLTGTNSYTGATTVSAGTLVGNTASLEGSFLDGSVLTFDQTISSISDGTFSGSVSGAGNLNVLAGTVRLAPGDLLQNSGSSTITGTLVGPSSGGTDALSPLSSYTVNGVLDLGASDQAIGSLSGNGTVYHVQPDGQPVLATLTVGGDNSNTTFAGVLQDTASASGNGGFLALNKVGAGTLTLTGANTFTGGTTISAGTLDVSTSALAGNITVNFPGTLAFDESDLPGASGLFSGTVSGTGIVHILSGSSVQLGITDGSTPSTFANSGPTVIDAVATLIAGASDDLGPNSAFLVNGTLDLAGFSQTIGSLAGASAGLVYNLSTQPNLTATLTVGADNSSTSFAGVLEDTAPASGNGGILALDKIGAATLTLSGTNSYTGGTTISAGTLDGSTSALNGNITVNSPGTLTFDESGLSGASGSFSGTVSGTGTVHILSGSSVELGTPNGSTPSTFTNSGPTIIDTGATLIASATNDIGSSSPIFNSGLLSLTGPAGTSLALGLVTVSAGSQFNTAANTTMTLGPVTGGAGATLTKLGPGTLVLTAADSYGGSTIVSAGILLAETGASLPGGAVNIGSSATVQLQQNPTPFTANVSSLSISAGGKLDIANNTLFIKYGSSADPIAAIRAYLVNGFNNFAWTGKTTGGNILSTTAANNSARNTGIGYIDSADGTGYNTTPNSIELKYALYGDTNLDGTVNQVDQKNLHAHFRTTGDSWDEGDSNYDGAVNSVDQSLLADNLGMTLNSSAASAAAAPAATLATPLRRKRR